MDAEVADVVDAPEAIADAAPPVETRILSLNLHCLKNDGTSFTTTAARLDAIADFAARARVTAIAVQEACVRSENAMTMLAASLERTTGIKWSTTWTFAHKAWEGTADEADEGVGILARGALRDPESIEHRVQSALVRVAASARIEDFRLYSVHFDHQNEAARTAQAREIAVRALVDSDPVFDAIVAGDFNARPGTDAHAAFVGLGFRDLSSSGGIDHVVAHGALHGTGKLVLDGTDGPRVSDHPGVLVTLSRTPTKPAITRIIADASLSTGQWLAIRGANAPFSWTSGWPLHENRIVLTEARANEVKLLRNDTAWMTGANVSITPGTDTTITPTF